MKFEVYSEALAAAKARLDNAKRLYDTGITVLNCAKIKYEKGVQALPPGHRQEIKNLEEEVAHYFLASQ
ncbi:hypothetical protein [Paenibacillus sinopodophylli]|uniref:hypothetical protein n=1 Tax=Paenibacillus sinopodophylli TaxID=1837342 RepID=UPI00110CD88B|nr:hypothetical protein [Paenibacillus sinopodophylli]